MIINFKIWKIRANIVCCLSKTVPALKIAFSRQYYVEEREPFPLPVTISAKANINLLSELKFHHYETVLSYTNTETRRDNILGD